MVEFQRTGFGAAPSRADEGAAALIAGPNGAAQVRWHMARASSRWRCQPRRSARSRDSARLSPLELRQQKRERPVEDGGGIAVGYRMPEQVTGPDFCCVPSSTVILMR
jgi:hypothetical protein